VQEVVVGREDDIRAVAGVLAATGEAARVLLVTGGAGMGKTAVLEEALRAAVRSGTAVLRLGREDADDEGGDGADSVVVSVGSGLALADPGSLLTVLSPAEWSQLRSAARVGGVSGLAAFSEALALAARRTPLALVVDGVDGMPEPAVDAVGMLLRVFRPRGVPVVMAGRAWPVGDPLRAQLSAAADDTHVLSPLSAADAARLVDLQVTRRFGRPADPALADAVSRSLGTLAGNPRAMLSVLAALDGQDLLELDGRMYLARAEKHLRLTTEEAFLLGLGHPHVVPYGSLTETAIVTARVLDHADVYVDDAFRMLPSASARALEFALDRLISDRVLTAGPQGRLSFAVPALAAALRLLPTRRDVQGNSARYVAKLAGRLGAEATGRGYPRLADRVAASGPLLDDALAVPLLLAAAREEAGTDWARSSRAYAAALARLSPQDRRTPGVLREATGLSLRHGDHHALLALGEPLRARLDAGDPAELETAAGAWVWAALHEHRSLHADDTVPLCRETLERLPSAARLAALGGLYGIGPLPPSPSAPLRTPRTDVRTPLPSPAELHLLTAATGGHDEVFRAWQSMPDDAVDEQAVSRLRDAAAYADLSGALAAVLGGRYVTEESSVAGRYRGMVRDYLAGDWDGALAAARRIEVHSRTHAAAGVSHTARALAAEIHCARGDVERARAWLDLVPDGLAHPLAARARLAVRYGSGEPEAALERAREDARLARKSGLLAGVERVLLRILSLAAEDGAAHTVHRSLEELETLHEEAATPMSREALLLARGIAHHDTDSALAAHRSIQGRGDAHLSVVSGLCLADIADDPRSWLSETLRTAHGLGLGRPFRTAVQRTAKRRGIPVPRLRRPHATLTDVDLRLVRMVSDGATNRQIATELACSPKTVEQRLARLFQRTGSRSRTELTAAWHKGALTGTDDL